MTPTALPLALALFFQPADPSEQYVLIRIQPVGIHEPAEVVRRRLTERLLRPERSIRVALQSPDVAPLLLGQPALARWVADNVRADWPGEGEILRLRLRAQGPAGAVMLNALADAFVRWELEEERRKVQWRKTAWQETADGLRRAVEGGERIAQPVPVGSGATAVAQDHRTIPYRNAHTRWSAGPRGACRVARLAPGNGLSVQAIRDYFWPVIAGCTPV